jgi:hypothetical protein
MSYLLSTKVANFNKKGGYAPPCVGKTHLFFYGLEVIVERFYTKLKELFGFCETLPVFQTLATLVFRAIKLLSTCV